MNMNRIVWPGRAALAAGFFLILAALYLGKGFAGMLFDPDMKDLGLRWVEQHYVLRHQNPFDVAFRAMAEEQGRTPPAVPRDARTDPELGVPYLVDYPPWSYFSGVVLFWPGERPVRAWYAGWNLLGLVIIGGWVYRQAAGLDRSGRVAVVAASLAFSSVGFTLNAGNYGIIVLALLCLAFDCAGRGRPVLAGFCLGVAMLKPTLAGPFAFAFLVRRQALTLASATAYLVGASLVVWGWTRTDPVEMLRQMLHAGESFVADGSGPINLAILLGLPRGRAVLLTATTMSALGLVVMARRPQAPLLFHFACAAVVARLWTYHMTHSNLILLFPFVALVRAVFVDRVRSAGAAGALALLGVTLWLPGRVSYFSRPVQVAENLIWIGTWLVLVALAGRVTGPRPAPAPAEA